MLKIFSSLLGSKTTDAKLIDNLEIISDFYQGTAIVSDKIQSCSGNERIGNCATLALIKSALVESQSISLLFKKFKQSKDSVRCKFRDGTKVSVNKEDINLVAQLSGFEKNINSRHYHEAIILYALICKRVLKKRRHYSRKCIKTFQDAVEFINCGFNTENVPELLALEKEVIPVDRIPFRKNVIIYNQVHASYCSFGKQDFLGEIYHTEGQMMNNPVDPPSPITHAFVISV